MWDYEKTIDNNTLAALTLLIAESNPKEKDVIVDHSVIMPGAVLKSGSVVKFAIIGESSVIESGAWVGSSRDEIPYGEKWDIAVIGHGETISSGITVAPGQMIPAK